MSEYLDLYSAIWKQAIDDDINEVVKELTIHGFNSAYEFFALNYLEKNADNIIRFNDNESTINCIKVIEELQEIKIVDACNSLAIYKTENETYIIIIDKTIYIIKNKDNYIAKNDERFKKFKSELSEYSKIKARELEQHILITVYRRIHPICFSK